MLTRSQAQGLFEGGARTSGTGEPEVGQCFLRRGGAYREARAVRGKSRIGVREVEEWERGCSVVGPPLECSTVRKGRRGIRAMEEVVGMRSWAEEG